MVSKIKDGYIIIRRSTIEKRIERIGFLKKDIVKKISNFYKSSNQNTIEQVRYKESLNYNLFILTREEIILKQMLSESSSLIQEIEKAFNLEEDL